MLDLKVALQAGFFRAELRSLRRSLYAFLHPQSRFVKFNIKEAF